MILTGPFLIVRSIKEFFFLLMVSKKKNLLTSFAFLASNNFLSLYIIFIIGLTPVTLLSKQKYRLDQVL